MSQKNEVNIRAARVGLAIMAFGMLEGDRPVMLSYRIGRVIETLQGLQQVFLERIKPYVNTETGGVRDDLTDEETALVEEMLNEELTLLVHPVTLQDLEDAELTVKGDDDTVLPFLVQHGLLRA